MANTFKTIILPYLKDTNLYGNIYFARYFEWQGVVREAFLYECLNNQLNLLNDYILVTKSASIDYKKPAYAFQKILATLNTHKIKIYSFDLIINFYIDNDLISEGKQTIVFTDKKGKLIIIPEVIKSIAQEFLIDR